MTAEVDVVNESLQKIGTRTTVTATELANSTTNEAIQANIILHPLRDRLLRMAPWNCSTNYFNAVYITSAPGTPENPTQATALWQKGQPSPPWAYEYQFPIDCLRPLLIVPQYTPGTVAGVPITTAITAWSSVFWQGPPIRFKVGVDQFFPVTAATVQAGGTGHAIGDQITLAGTPAGSNPIGAPVVLSVATVGAGGAILTVNVVNQVEGEASPLGGSYFAVQANPVAQGSTTGVGVGATFNLTFGAKSDQRVILTNQENALLCYVKQIIDPNVMDQAFRDAWSELLASRLALALTGDKALANMKIQTTNAIIVEARKMDGNEGLTINDVTPDWIRIRGVDFTDTSWSPNMGFDWGALWPLY